MSNEAIRFPSRVLFDKGVKISDVLVQFLGKKAKRNIQKRHALRWFRMQSIVVTVVGMQVTLKIVPFLMGV